MLSNKLFALIVAGGSGTRMEHSIPKQFISLDGQPILFYTIRAFSELKEKVEVLIVLPAAHIPFWEELCKKYNFAIPHRIVEGGTTRSESVINGLKVLPDSGLVAVHDGVRPFVSEEIILKSFDVASVFGTAVAAVDLKDSIREITLSGSKAVNRSEYKIIQTPQTFKIPLIKEAYSALTGNFTDDAAVVELSGVPIKLIEGSYDNIKITTPEDLIIAEQILKRRKL